MAEAEDTSRKEMDKALFMNLVMMFSTSVMQQLGKIVNPVTKRAEVDLDGAQAAIGMLTMLQAKTAGNLDKDEERFMKQTVSMLQMNFVETAASAGTPPQQAADGQGGGEPPTEQGGKSTDDVKSAGGTPGKAEKEPKFRKTYD